MTTRRDPTPIQFVVMRFVADFYDRHGYAPTLAEIPAHISRSKMTAYEHLNTLERKGLIERTVAHKSRNVAVTDRGRSLLPAKPRPKIPVLGRLVAGGKVELR